MIESVGSSGDSILSLIKEKFKSHRGPESGKSTKIPVELRELAVKAIGKGHSIAEVAAAAGIAPKSIRNWRNQPSRVTRLATPRARRLEVVTSRAIKDNRANDNEVSFGLTTLVKLQLRSGVVIELPLNVLSNEFLQRLNELGGERC